MHVLARKKTNIQTEISSHCVNDFQRSWLLSCFATIAHRLSHHETVERSCSRRYKRMGEFSLFFVQKRHFVHFYKIYLNSRHKKIDGGWLIFYCASFETSSTSN